MDGLVQGILQASEGSCTLIHWRCLGGCHHVRSRSENGDWGVLQILTLKKQENSWSQRDWPKCVVPENIHTPATKEGISCKYHLPSQDFHFVETLVIYREGWPLLRHPYHLQKIVLARKCVKGIWFILYLCTRLGRWWVGATNCKILFHLPHGRPRISSWYFWFNGKCPQLPIIQVN